MSASADHALVSIGERLTRQFYHWEKPGRGWQVFAEPVALEPAFEPFIEHYFEQPSPAVDDGLSPRLWTRAARGIHAFFAGRPSPPQPVPPRQQVFPAPDVDWVTQGVMLPQHAEPELERFEQSLVTLGGGRGPICFEIVGTARGVRLQVACDRTRMDDLAGHLASYFPELVITEQDDALYQAWEANQAPELLTVDFGLSREFMFPLQECSKLPMDPYVSLMGAISRLKHGEMAAYQVLFEPVRNPWARSIWQAVTFSDGTPFFEDDEDFLDRAKAKIAKPLFAAVVRLIVFADDEERLWSIAQSLAPSLDQLSSSSGNALMPLSNDGYPQEAHFLDIFRRQSHRTGMLLNSEELTSLVHLPGQAVQGAKFERLKTRTKAAPASVQGHRLVLGSNVHRGQEIPVTMSPEQRVRHMHIIGASGTGKSTLLLNLIAEDIEQGQGIAVIDPHGDLIDQILARVPESRIKDVVLVDPSDEKYPIGFNILSAHSDLEKNLLASDLVAVFKRFSTSWGDQIGSVLSNAVLAFLESVKGGTLADLRRFLIEPAFRNEFLETVIDEHVLYYWKKEFPLLSGRPQAPLLTRLDTFLRPKPVRYMVSQRENRLDFASIMDSGKIFLAKLAQGAIGEENAALLGSLFVSKFHQLALGRQSQNEQVRRYFWLYCDEFGSYVTPSMSKLLSGARKFRLGLVLSHQELQQIHDTDVASALTGNPGTRVCFRIGESDSKSLADGFSFFEAEDLRNLGMGEAICRVGKAEDDFNLKVDLPREIEATVSQRRRKAIIEHSRTAYATLRVPIVAAAPTPSAQAPTAVTVATDPEGKEAPIKPDADSPVPPVPPDRLPLTPPDTSPPQPPTPPVPKPKKRKAAGPVVAPMGKGGQRHKYLQHLICQCGQQRGWRATIEMPVNGGSIDVVLERDGQRVAVEISVTTTVELELGNLRKCLTAGFTDIFILSEEPRLLANLQKAAEKTLVPDQMKCIRFQSPDEFIADDQILAYGHMPQEQLVRGYKVKVRREGPTTGDGTERRRAISEVMLRSMKKV